MIDKKFNKKCNVTTLTKELKDSGFALIGIDNQNDLTIVHLDDFETKDPTSIVDAHTYTEEQKKEPRDMEKEMDKLIARLKSLGIVDATW